MSTTIDIIPVDTIDITFQQVIELSEININNFLASIGVTRTLKLKVNIHDNKEEYVKAIQPSDKFDWQDNEYVWFVVEGIAGGTDARYGFLNGSGIDPENPWWLLDELQQNNKEIQNIREKLEKAKAWDRHWYLRRSAGQPAIINVAYGLIGASVAQLTNGILTSDDGAWDYERFPAHSAHFLEWYYKPEKALNKEHRDWAASCIEDIKAEFRYRR